MGGGAASGIDDVNSSCGLTEDVVIVCLGGGMASGIDDGKSSCWFDDEHWIGVCFGGGGASGMVDISSLTDADCCIGECLGGGAARGIGDTSSMVDDDICIGECLGGGAASGMGDVLLVCEAVLHFGGGAARWKVSSSCLACPSEGFGGGWALGIEVSCFGVLIGSGVGSPVSEAFLW